MMISSVKNGNFISEPQTDFIFAIVGEELGFVGGCASYCASVSDHTGVLERLRGRQRILPERCICCGMAAVSRLSKLR